MKNKIGIVILLLMAAVIVYGTATETHTHGTPYGGPGENAFRKVVITESDGDANDFSETTDPIYGYVERVSIVNTGVDGAFSITIADEAGITIFTSGTIDSDPVVTFSYAVSMSDTGSTEFCGVPVGGALTVTMADGDDASMTAISVYIYYRAYWQ